MKQFIVDRHTTPETPAMREVPTMKVPVYDTLADAEADLANLEDGQIITTKDTGDELSQPVDTVESGNLHAVTSNAVAKSLSYSTEEVDTGATDTDGKHIYKKTMNGTITATIQNVNHNIANLYNVKDVKGRLKNATPAFIPVGYFATSSGTNYYFSALVTETAIGLRVNTEYINAEYEVTIYYTKTTV